ncbi:hypothetical protein QA640_10335 [Bradyrhizobium sp. CB82]|uniref:hypothetical protein n=1 Tax=Bradyrhizobium sp. CB82 TaxID=3039159 RepID=UPI0024B20286|nr:hypothetical protein [Bradyrhizobium sp. CB82]WFU42813.1 hypothetical protein QA640_10335 [Bradyrhizobium sp. CB82]
MSQLIKHSPPRSGVRRDEAVEGGRTPAALISFGKAAFTGLHRTDTLKSQLWLYDVNNASH